MFKLRTSFMLWFLAGLGWLLIIAGGVLWWGLPRWVPDVVVEESPWLGPAFEAAVYGRGTQEKFTNRLPEWGDQVVPFMCSVATSNSDIKRRLVALTALQAKNAPGAMPTLLILLNDADEEIVQAALYGLWGSKDQALIQPVLDLMLRSSPEISRLAAHLLADRPQAIPFDLVSTTLLNSSEDHQALGCIVLQGSTDPRAIPALVERLGRFRHRNLDVAGYSLGQLLLPGTTEAIATAMTDPDPRRRYGAVTAVWLPNRKADRSALLQPLLALIADPEPEVRTHAVRALRNFSDEAAIDALRAIITAGGALAVVAVDNLIMNGSPAALPTALSFIDHPEADVRKKLRKNVRIFATIPKGIDHRLILNLLQHQDAEVVELAKKLAKNLKLTPDERRELDAAGK